MFVVTTLNQDGNKREFNWNDIQEFENEWNNGIDFPNLDDYVVYANIDGEDVDGNTFEDVITYLKQNYGIVENIN